MTILSISLAILLTIALLILLVPLVTGTKQINNALTKRTIITIALFIPIFSIGSYFALGTPEFAEIATQKPEPEMVTLVDKLEEKLAKNPKNTKGWLLLGRSHMITEDYNKAIYAFEKAITLEPNNLDAILPLADALAIMNAGNLKGRPYQLLQQAYNIKPENNMTLWLLGMAEKQFNNKPAAQKYWLALYKLLPNDSKDKHTVASLLASVGVSLERLASQTAPSTNVTVESSIDKLETTQPAEIHISFELTNQTRNKIAGSNIFIYAKQPQGIPMPIAAQRYQAANLPPNTTITAADELIPSRKLNQFNDLIIGIKITAGDAVGKEVLYKKEEYVSNYASVKFIIEL